MDVKFFATTVPGIEDVASHEIERLLGCKATPDIGKVFFRSDLNAMYRLNLESRMLHKVIIQLCRSRFKDLDDIYRIAKRIDYTWIIDPDQSFAIRSERVGVHNFTSMDISRVVGQAVIDSYINSKSLRLKVDLDEPDVEILCLVRDHEFLMGVNTTGPSLHRRWYRVYDHPAAIKSTIASAMIEMSGWKPDDSLIDPMCGGATIPIEASLRGRGVPPNILRSDFAFTKLKVFDAEEFGRAKHKFSWGRRVLRIYGMEKNRRYLAGGMMNAEEAGVKDDICFKLGDATRSSDYPDVEIEYVIVNPPYGLRLSPKERVINLYRGFLNALSERAEGSVLVLITAASRRFRTAALDVGVEIMEERQVLHGDLTATIFKCTI